MTCTRPAPQKRLSKRGRLGEGGQPSNQNARCREPLPWDQRFHLEDRENAEKFIVHMIKRFWIQNPLDARAAGALNNMLRLYCDVKGWITKAPIQVFQSQATITMQELDLEKIIRGLPLEIRDLIFKKWKEDVVRETNSGNQD